MWCHVHGVPPVDGTTAKICYPLIHHLHQLKKCITTCNIWFCNKPLAILAEKPILLSYDQLFGIPCHSFALPIWYNFVEDFIYTTYWEVLTCNHTISEDPRGFYIWRNDQQAPFAFNRMPSTSKTARKIQEVTFRGSQGVTWHDIHALLTCQISILCIMPEPWMMVTLIPQLSHAALLFKVTPLCYMDRMHIMNMTHFSMVKAFSFHNFGLFINHLSHVKQPITGIERWNYTTGWWYCGIEGSSDDLRLLRSYGAPVFVFEQPWSPGSCLHGFSPVVPVTPVVEAPVAEATPKADAPTPMAFPPLPPTVLPKPGRILPPPPPPWWGRMGPMWPASVFPKNPSVLQCFLYFLLFLRSRVLRTNPFSRKQSHF